MSITMLKNSLISSFAFGFICRCVPNKMNMYFTLKIIYQLIKFMVVQPNKLLKKDLLIMLIMKLMKHLTFVKSQNIKFAQLIMEKVGTLTFIKQLIK